MRIMLLGLVLIATLAAEKELAKRVIGVWALTTSVEKHANGSSIKPWDGGSLSLDANGNVMLYVQNQKTADSLFGSYSITPETSMLRWTAAFASSAAFSNAMRFQVVLWNGSNMVLTSTVTLPDDEVTTITTWKRE